MDASRHGRPCLVVARHGCRQKLESRLLSLLLVNTTLDKLGVDERLATTSG